MSNPPHLLAAGEVLWDLFPAGACFGGAPANLACHASALGCRVSMISRVGSDELGRRAIEFLRRRGVETAGVQTDARHPTGTVRIELDEAGKPTFDIVRDVAWDHLAWQDDFAPLTASADAICFGSLGQRSPAAADTIRRLVESVSDDRLKLLDLNLRPPHDDDRVILRSLELANALKLNDDELERVSRLLDLPSEIGPRLEALRDRHQLRLLVVTRGEDGSSLLWGDERSDLPGERVEIVDTVGAGDSFTAALLSGLLHGRSLSESHRWASRVAAYVCGQAGAVPPIPPELLRGAPESAQGDSAAE